MKRLVVFLPLFLLSIMAYGQQVNPTNQITWPRITVNSGVPTQACTSSNYGQPYQVTGVTPNQYGSCGTDGWAIRGSGGGGLSGQTTNCAPKAASATTSTSSLPICDDGTTTTITHPVLVNDGSGKNGTFGATAGTGNVTPAAGSVYYSQDGSDHATVAEGTNAYSRICTAANSVCSGGGGATLPTDAIVYGLSSTTSRAAGAYDIGNPGFTAVQNNFSVDSANIGDSFQVCGSALNAAGVNDQSLCWAQLAERNFGTFTSNYSFGGIPSETINAQQANMKLAPSTGSIYFMDTGFTNDTEEFTNSANWLKLGQRALQGTVFRALIPDANKNFLQSATLSGSCALDGTTYQANQGVNCASGGSITTTATVGSSGVLEGCYQVVFGGTSTFTINVAGTNRADPITSSTTWITYGDGSQTIGGNATNFCAGFRIAGLTPGSNSVVITGAGFFNFQWLGSPAAVSASNPTLYILDVPQLASGVDPSGYTALWQTVATNVFALASGDSENITVIPARSLLGANPGSAGNWSGDNIHPSAQGYGLLANSAITSGHAVGQVLSTPDSFSGQGGHFYPPATVDSTKGFSFNPAWQQQPDSWAGMVSHINHLGSAVFEGDADLGVGYAGHTYAIGGPDGTYNWCDNHGVSNSQFLFPPATFDQCIQTVVSGGIDWAVPSSEEAGILLRYDAITFDYYNRGFAANFFGPTTFGTNQVATSSVAQSAPIVIVSQAGIWDGVNPKFAGHTWNEVATNGINQPIVLTGGLVNPGGGYTAAIGVDLTGWVANGGLFKIPSPVLAGVSSSTSPVCPNGTGGTLTTAGCSGGSGFPITLGSTSIAASSTTTAIAGITSLGLTSAAPLMWNGDTGLSRHAADVVRCGNGTFDDASCEFDAAKTGLATTTFGANSKLAINPAGTLDAAATVQITTSVTGAKGLVLQTNDDGSGNLLEAQNSAGTSIASIAGAAATTPGLVSSAFGFNSHVYTVSTLPAAVTAGAGTMVVVSDASTFTVGTCTGGGSDTMIAVSNGTTWSCH